MCDELFFQFSTFALIIDPFRSIDLRTRTLHNLFESHLYLIESLVSFTKDQICLC